LNDLESRYELVNSTKYKPILEVYNNRSDFYEPEFYQNIFNFEMFDLFKELKEKEINYLEFISQLAKVNALSEVYKRYRYNSKIYEFMFIVNDFSEFELWEFDVSSKNIEHHPLFNKYLYKFRVNEDLTRYKNFDDFLIEEDALKGVKDKNVTQPENKKGKSDSLAEVNGFDIKEDYIERIKKMYLLFAKHHIDEVKTDENSFIKVLTKKWGEHDDVIYFKCDTQFASLLLYRLKFVFQNFSQVTISKSKKFITNMGSNVGQTTISHGLDAYRASETLKPYSKIDFEKLNLMLSSDQIEGIHNVESIVSRLRD